MAIMETLKGAAKAAMVPVLTVVGWETSKFGVRKVRKYLADKKKPTKKKKPTSKKKPTRRRAA